MSRERGRPTAARATFVALPSNFRESASPNESTFSSAHVDADSRVNSSIAHDPGSRHEVFQGSGGSLPHEFKINDASNVSPQIQKATTTFPRNVLFHTSGIHQYIPNQGLLPSTNPNVWPLPDVDSSFYSPLNPPFPLPATGPQNYMTPSVAVQFPLDITSSQPNPFLYNFTAVPTPYRRDSNPSNSLQTVQRQAHRPPMITLGRSTSPVSPVSLNDDEKSSVVSPRLRSSSNASVPSISAPSPSMSDLQSEQDRSYRLPRIIPPRREGEPPKNANGKLICIVDTRCDHLTFERKCEWSKHMDKHDRPYKCSYPQCSKLQGFTYSGGLLRHEREVHKKHGGPRESLMCPFKDCKRSTGAGFTRKENLNEHLRRVHRRAEDEHPSRSDDPSALDRDDSAEAHGEDESALLLLGKRKRDPTTNEAAATSYGLSEGGLYEEVKRLRRENEEQKRQNAEKDAKIANLEATIRHFAGQSR
ncbi:MAG: hypothetical protein Q9165_006123 [Trypethelium subeluteriae]